MTINLTGVSESIAAMFLSFTKGFFVHERVDNCDPRIHEFLLRNNFVNGSSLFHGASALECGEFKAVCSGALDQFSDDHVNWIMINYVLRLRTFCDIMRFEAGRLQLARVERREDASDVCLEFAGRVVPVGSCFAILRKLQISTPQEQYAAFRLRDQIFPPFHLRCRCVLEGLIPGVNYDS